MLEVAVPAINIVPQNFVAVILFGLQHLLVNEFGAEEVEDYFGEDAVDEGAEQP